jgi:rSAM/selenodomain-associated transferase 1
MPSTSLYPEQAIALFARRPAAGRVKTRLIPLLGPQSAALLQAAFLQDSIRRALSCTPKTAIWLYLTGEADQSLYGIGQLAGNVRWREQPAGNLGERLTEAFRFLLRRHQRVVITGTDSPQLLPALLRQALRELRASDAALGPCPDGGYYLIGLRRGLNAAELKRVFEGVRWSTRFAFRDTLRNLAALNLTCSVLDPVPDVDRPGDFLELQKRALRDARLRRAAPATWRFIRSQLGAPKPAAT